MQELRQEVKDINSRPPQPEDPERSLDPDSEEDPDISVELIDGVFHQLSKDNTLVAIVADYPGLIPASEVTETGVFIPLKGIPFSRNPAFLATTVFHRGDSRGGKANLRRLAHEEPQGPVGKKEMQSEPRYRRKGNALSVSAVLFRQGVLTFVPFSGRRDLTGLYPKRMPIALPPAR